MIGKLIFVIGVLQCVKVAESNTEWEHGSNRAFKVRSELLSPSVL